MGVVLRTERLTKRFDRLTAVENLDLEVREGEVFGFLGPNGAGKTTTLRLLCALISPTSGSAEVAGFRLGAPDEQTERYLRLMGLWDRRGEAVATFSRGMKQKMAIARAAIHEPRIIFLDEPTTGLDPDAARTVREFIAQIRGEGRTVFLCTHNLDEADRLCDRIAFFRRTIIRIDTPADLRAELYGNATEFRIHPSPRPEHLVKVQAVDGVKDAHLENGSIIVSSVDPLLVNPRVVRALVGAGAEVAYVSDRKVSLEDVYLRVVDGT